MTDYKKIYQILIYSSIFLINRLITTSTYISIYITNIFSRKSHPYDFANAQNHKPHFLMSRQR